MSRCGPVVFWRHSAGQVQVRTVLGSLFQRVTHKSKSIKPKIWELNKSTELTLSEPITWQWIGQRDRFYSPLALPLPMPWRVTAVQSCCCAPGSGGWNSHLAIGKTIRFEKRYVTLPKYHRAAARHVYIISCIFKERGGRSGWAILTLQAVARVLCLKLTTKMFESL